MPKKSLKSKRGTSKKGGKGYKRTRKMKGGVSYNPVFSTTLLPKGTYYEINNYNDDPSRPPEVVDSRLLPTLTGGKKKNTRKRRGGKNEKYRKFHEWYHGRKSKGEQDEIDAKTEEEKQARKEDMEANYTEFLGDMLYDNFDKIDKKDPLKNVNFYYFDMGYNKRELGKLIKKGGQQYVSEYGGYSRNNSLLEFEKSTMVASTQWTDQNIQQPNSFYVLTTDFEKKGGKKSRKSRRKRKMKGGSLVGTDLITGLNTTNTNSVIAFGTTGGTEYMYNTLAGKSIDSGPYMSPETPVEPVLA